MFDTKKWYLTSADISKTFWLKYHFFVSNKDRANPVLKQMDFSKKLINCFKFGFNPYHILHIFINFLLFSLSNWLSYHVWAGSSQGVSEIGSMMAAQRYNCVKIGSHLTLHDLGCHTTTMFATPQGVNYCDRTSS